MHRITPVVVFLLVLAACGSDSEEADPTTTAAVESTETTADAIDQGEQDVEGDADTATTSTTEVVADESTSSTTDAAVEEEPDDEIGILCSAYLESITPGSIDLGLKQLTEILGEDAPAGVQAAMETLLDPEGDVEGYFEARNSIDGYILPICEDRFTSAIVPELDNATAADLFVDALRDGNRPGGERLAPANVVTLFDWNGYSQMTSEFSPDNSTLLTVLEPTVTVFCQLDGGAVEFCAFGE